MISVRQRLFSMRDEEYLNFSAPLIPNIPRERMIGVRTPFLRKYAAELFGTDTADEFMNNLPHTYLEENNLHGFLIERISDFDRCIEALDSFLPYVDNWATCDSIRPKVFKKHLSELETHIRRWLSSGQTYTVRFAVEMLMCFYLDESFSPEYPELVSMVIPGEYYTDMMSAWYFATALAKQWNSVFPYISERRLSPWVHNKTIQKATESYRITPEQKSVLRKLKLSAKKANKN